MRFQKEHRIELPVARYFELSFNPDFMRRLNVEGMKVQAYDVLERNVDGPRWTLRSRVSPQDNMPGFLKKLIGGGFSYEEHLAHEKGSTTATCTMTPSVMRDKLTMKYTMTLTPEGDHACRRTMAWDLEVRIFGVGGQIEKFAASEIERGMDASAAFMSQHGKPAA